MTDAKKFTELGLGFAAENGLANEFGAVHGFAHKTYNELFSWIVQAPADEIMNFCIWVGGRSRAISPFMSKNEVIGRKIRKLRESLKESQELFAERLGVTQGAVSKWERTGEMPKRQLWGKIAEAAGMSTAEFFYDATSGGLRPDVLREVLISAFRLQGAPSLRARVLADAVIEGAIARQALGAGDQPEDDADLQKELRALQSGGQSPS